MSLRPAKKKERGLDKHKATVGTSSSSVYANGSAFSATLSDSPPNQSDSKSGSESAVGSSTLSTTASILSVWAPTLVLIFGGCCSNVYTLEALIQASPNSGPLITAFQFLLVALAALPRHLSRSRGWRRLYLRERAVPLRKWVVYTAYFLSVNVLNNVAFRYRISVPLHIILRSAGPVSTMVVGRVWGGKRYPTQKVVAVWLLFVGVVVAAFADASSKAEETTDPRSSSSPAADEAVDTSAAAWSFSQAPGFALLASALVLSACMGLYTDDMYATHGRSGAVSAEALFYSHALSLPYFASQVKPLMREFAHVASAVAADVKSSESRSGPRSMLSTSPSSSWSENSTSAPVATTRAIWDKILPDTLTKSGFPPSYVPPSIALPRPVLLLLLNAGTQLLCIVGVNRLSAQSSSLTVSIVLNVRKLASLVLSIWLFGTHLPAGVALGAAVVFVGGGLYAVPASASAPATTTKVVAQAEEAVDDDEEKRQIQKTRDGKTL
jgi:UDP-xylose/UDP-N-acetylglucosamine transporter B4